MSDSSRQTKKPLTLEDLKPNEMFCRECGYIDTIERFTYKGDGKGTNVHYGEHVCPLCKHRQMFPGSYFGDKGHERLFRKNIYGPYHSSHTTKKDME